jgi:hypothetical protein
VATFKAAPAIVVAAAPTMATTITAPARHHRPPVTRPIQPPDQ